MPLNLPHMNILNSIDTGNLLGNLGSNYARKRGRPTNASLGLPTNPSYVTKKEIYQMKQLV